METLVTREYFSGKSPREKERVLEIRHETVLWRKDGMVLWMELWMEDEMIVLIWYVMEPNKSPGL